jgi:TolB-like protein
VPVVAGLAFAGFKMLHSKAAASRIGTDSDPNHIAVMYFDDRSDGGSLRSLADGLTESLIDELSAVKGLKVISRNGVAPYKGKDVATDSLQRAFKVGTLVTGKIEQAGDRLRVRVSLIDALTKNELASKTLEKPRANVFDLQDALAKEVSQVLRTFLGNEIETLVNRPGTSNAQAWEALQHAKLTFSGADTILAMGGVQPALARLSAADSEFAQVETMDKKWAAPIVARGFIAFRKMQMYGNIDATQIPKWLDVAMGHADRAVANAPNDANALELRGTIRLFRWLYNRTPDPSAPTKLLIDAETDFKSAVKANPIQATAWNGLSFVLNTENKFSESKLAAQSAYDSDPYLKDIDRTIWRLFQASMDLNDRTEAEKWCTIGRQRVPNNFRFTECKLWLFSFAGFKPSPDSIWNAYREFVDRSPANVKELNKLKGGMLAALGLFRAGLADSAKSVASRSRGNPQVDPASVLFVYEAHFRSQSGDKNEAIRLLTDFYAKSPQQHAMAKDDHSWWWDPIHDDPRYKSLVGETG